MANTVNICQLIQQRLLNDKFSIWDYRVWSTSTLFTTEADFMKRSTVISYLLMNGRVLWGSPFQTQSFCHLLLITCGMFHTGVYGSFCNFLCLMLPRHVVLSIRKLNKFSILSWHCFQLICQKRLAKIFFYLCFTQDSVQYLIRTGLQFIHNSALSYNRHIV